MKNVTFAVTFILALNFLASCASVKKDEVPPTNSWAPKSTGDSASPIPPPLVESTQKQDSVLSPLQCSKGADVQTLQVVAKDTGCELDSTKNGQMTVTAASSHNLKHCTRAQRKMKVKLEKQGYTCEIKN